MFKIEKYLKKMQKRFERNEKIIKDQTIDFIDDKIDELEQAQSYDEAFNILSEMEHKISEREHNKNEHRIAMIILKTAIEKIQKGTK